VPGTLEYEHDTLGYNYTLSNVAAAVGLAQLERLEALVAHRRHLAARYAAALEGTDLTFCAEVAPARSNYWLMSVLADDKDAVIQRLSAAGIDSRPFFVPMPDLPHLAPYATGPVPVAARLHRHGVSIPSSADLDDAAQDRVIAALLG
jgi:dTDP-4-amino-4,6-dideoxygalactose transaminase